MSIRLLFPDGSVLRAPTATRALLLWGAVQWTPVKDVTAIKEALSDRAWLWSATAIDPRLPDDEFLTAVEASGLAAVTWDGTKAKPSLIRPPIRERDPGA